VNIEKISAVTLKVSDMTVAVRFYRDVLGMEIIYGGEDDCFSSLRTKSLLKLAFVQRADHFMIAC